MRIDRHKLAECVLCNKSFGYVILLANDEEFKTLQWPEFWCLKCMEAELDNDARTIGELSACGTKEKAKVDG
jgi:hypothetical protein